MATKGRLREFQAHLAARLAGVAGSSAAGLLGVQSGTEYWLVNLADSGEVVPLPPLTEVPLTKPWFVGMANIRGNLHAVTDFSAFQDKESTPQNAASRLLLIGTRYGNNAALLVNRMLGLRNRDDLVSAAPDAGAPEWAAQVFTDKEGRRWKFLDVKALLADEAFMDIGVSG